MTLTPDFPDPDRSSPDDNDVDAINAAPVPGGAGGQQFADEDLSGLDFDLPDDFVVPDDLSELDTMPPATHHEDPDGSQWDEPDWLANNPPQAQVPHNTLQSQPAQPAPPMDFDSELAEMTGEKYELVMLLTPVADARALAAACALVGLDVIAVPNPSGAVAILKDTSGDAPERAGSALSGLLPSFPVLLLTKASGQLTATRFIGGQPPQEVPAGLLVAGASGIVEDLIIGQTTPAQVPGAVSSAGVSRTKAMMWLAKIAKHKRGSR